MFSVEHTLSNLTPNGGSDEIKVWLQSAASARLLTKDETIEIARQVQALPEGSARRRRLANKLVKHNMRLVAYVVKSFMRSSSHRPWGSPDTLDFLQVGCIGLMKAVEKYDPARGYTFSTYASHWIRSAIGRYNLKTITPVHVPESAARDMIFYRRNGYCKTHAGALRSTEWVAKAERDIEMAYNYYDLDRPLSEAKAGCSERHTLGDLIPAPKGEIDPDAFHRAILDAMDRAGISDVGQEILVKSLVDGWTLKEISAEMGVNFERVKQEKRKALNQAKANREVFRDVVTLGE